MSWAGSSKLNFKLCFTFPLCMSVHSFLSLWSFPWFFFGRPLKGCPLKCGAPPPTPIFFQSIVWSPSGRWKEAWSGCYSFYSIYTGRIQGFVLSITCHLVETTHFFFLKSCERLSNKIKTEWSGQVSLAEGEPPGSLAWPSKTKNFNGDKSKRTQVATKLNLP